jgi:hypothetical protein
VTRISWRNIFGEIGFWSGETAFTKTRRPSARRQRAAKLGE